MRLSYLVLALVILGGGLEASEVSTTPSPRPTKRNMQRFAESQKNKYTYVFIGDSITHGWESKGKKVLEKHFGDKKILNIATSGDRTEHQIWAIDQVNWGKVNAKVAMVMVGTNNTGQRHAREEAPEDTFEGIKVILEKLKEKTPGTKILLLAIFPRGATQDHALRMRNDKVNTLISKLADNKRVFFMDINAKLLEPDGKTLSKDIMPDLLHPNEKGYEIWAEAVKAKLEELAKGH